MTSRPVMVVLLVAVGCLFACGSFAAQRMAVADINRIAEITQPVFSPDARRLVYTVSAQDIGRDEMRSALWSVPWRGGTPTRLTRDATSSQWQPRFSQDGKWLAYLSEAGKDAVPQVWMQSVNASGSPGRARRITALPGGVSDYDVAPDGRHVVVVAEVGANVGSRAKTSPPIVIDRFQFKEDGRGYLDDRRQHLFVVDVKSGTAAQLTQGDFDHWMPSWSPDGRWIAFVSKRRADADRNVDFDVFIIAPDAGSVPRKISMFDVADMDPDWGARPQWSPDSKRLVWLQAGEDKWIYYAPNQLAVGDIATGQITTPARIDRSFYAPRWSADGQSIYALIEQDCDTWLARIDPASSAITYLTSGARFASDFAVAANGALAVLDGDVQRPADLRTVEATPRALTDVNPWLRDIVLGAVRDVSFRSDGMEIHGLLVTPPDYQPGTALPMIVRLHGGPVYQFSHEFMADWQIYAAQGYAVLGINPRGSSGRGFDFARAIYADWGRADAADIRAGVDHVIGLGVADPAALGVGGWSYGSILTNYVIASDPRFKAAVSGAGMSNAWGNYGVDQYAREYELELGLPWRNAEAYSRVSYPFLHADRIKTPTLFQCAGADVNMPCVGAEQMYQALRSLDVPTRLIVYPGETHHLTVPSYIRDRMQRDLDWYDRFLKPSAQPGALRHSARAG